MAATHVYIGGGITGVNFTDYANIYSTTFVAASGSIPLKPADDQIVVGARISDPRLNGTSFVNAGDAVTISWPNSTQIPVTNSTYTATVAAVLDKIGGFSVGGPADTGVYVPISKAESFFGTDQASEIVVKLKNSDNATITNVSKAITDYFGNQVSVISSTAVLSLVSHNLQHNHNFPCRHRSHFASRRRHRHNEHHDSLADRTDT